MKPNTTWILIADGASAKVFEHKKPGEGLTQVPGLSFAQEHLRSGDIQADRPGRSFSSAGNSRSAMEAKTDPVDKREADFVTGVAANLDEKLGEKAFDRLIVAAAPKAMGNLRKAFTKRLQSAIIAEIPKDYTNTPIADLSAHFKDVLAT